MKLVALSCFFIEGKTAFPDPEKRISKSMKYKNIIASIQLLTLRSNINVFYTKDPEHTANTLAEFIRLYEKIESDKEKGRVSISLSGVKEEKSKIEERKEDSKEKIENREKIESGKEESKENREKMMANLIPITQSRRICFPAEPP